MSAPAASREPLPPALAEFIQSGLSITIASCNARRVPAIAKAVGCGVSADAREVTLLVFAEQAQAVLDDLRVNAQLAVCFNRPSTHQTVQLKGSDARVAPALPAEVAVARRCLGLLLDDLLPLGFTRTMLDTFFWHDPATLQAVRFHPHAAFAQTPGPAAGSPLAA